MTDQKSPLHVARRQFLRTAGAGVVGPALGGLGSGLAYAQTVNPIVTENAKPSTNEWVPFDFAANREIEGYAQVTSVNRGGSFLIYVNTAEPTYTVDVFRLGWYGGIGGRRMTNTVTRTGIRQVIPTPHPVTGRVECKWTSNHRVTTGTSWVSGVYIIKITAGISQKSSLIRFIVRDDARATQLMFQSSVTTDQAYNAWGGKSLYSYNSTGNIPAVEVSFDRPYDTDSQGAGFFFSWEFQMLRFLEREGYDVKYCTNIDLHRSGTILNNCKGFLSVGHDEYWTYEMRQRVEAARANRVHLGFFSANSCYWQVRLAANSSGASLRTMIGYKFDYLNDPLYGVDNRRVTTRWRDVPVSRPEDALLGVGWMYYPVDTDMVVSNANHWVFAGTGLNNGDRLPGLVGYEADTILSNSRPGLTALCTSPVDDGTNSGFSHMTIYTATSGALVFATGSMQFCWGLDDADSTSDPLLVNPKAQQMARNVLARFV